MHAYLRAVTATQLIEHQDLYDKDSGSFVLHNTCVSTPCYRSAVQSALTDGSYAELIHLFALSAGLNLPVQSYCTPGTHNIAGIHPYSIRIEKNDFRSGMTESDSEVVVMWTVRERPAGVHIPEPNHFVVLVPRSSSTGITVTPEIDRQPQQPEIANSDGPATSNSPKLTMPSNLKDLQTGDAHPDSADDDIVDRLTTPTPASAQSNGRQKVDVVEETSFDVSDVLPDAYVDDTSASGINLGVSLYFYNIQHRFIYYFI